jgi:polyhydroxyalkanoate synthesis regulator phasin
MSTPPFATGFFDVWNEALQQSQRFWTQTTTVTQAADPAQIWGQLFTLWTELCSKVATLSPDSFQAAQKLWMEQLEVLSQGFAKAMDTTAFAAMQNKLMEQSLVWQDKTAQAMHPQIDSALQAMHLPSRGQIDRLFERIIGLEERLDDLEAATRQILRILRQAPAPAEADVYPVEP